MDEKDVCKESPDKKHHYKNSDFVHAVYIENGYHEDLVCAFCGHKRCHNVFFPKTDPLTLPTDEDLKNDR